MVIEFQHWQAAREDSPEPGPKPKLGVVIPALDEEATVGGVVARVPRHILGIGEVEVIVVDDCSSDETGRRAYDAGADRVITHGRKRGLVASFNHGVGLALARRADVVVHLDADGQHDPALIPQVVNPILRGGADIVVGVRPLAERGSGTLVRRYASRFVSRLFRRAVYVPTRDVTFGYRAFSREALLQLNVVSDYTYTIESLILAARTRLQVTEVQISA